jgi:CopG family nickel-responsive transcriptional regulator
VQHFAEHVIAERGVRHGRIVLVPTDVLGQPHQHGPDTDHPHEHRPPRRSKRSA